MTLTFTRSALVLGLLAAVGPFAIDMYLPAMPTIAINLNASTAATQMTILAYFSAFGIFQLIYGPVSDVVGRKPPLYVGLGIFILGSIGCALAPSIQALVALRAVQGIGSSSVMVILRAIIRDQYTGTQATRLMSLVMLVFSVSPIFAPLVGSELIVISGWRVLFFVLAGVAMLSFALTVFVLPETHHKTKRVKSELADLARSVGYLLTHKRFLGLTSIGGLGMCSFFIFIASSSFVYMSHFGLTPRQYGFTFSMNAVGFIGASQFAAHLGERFGMSRVVGTAVMGFAVFALALLGLTLAGVDSLAVLIVLLFICFAFLGLVVPSSMVLALDDHGPIAGMASALGGTLQMVIGGIGVAGISAFSILSVTPMVSAIAICSVIASTISFFTLIRNRDLAAAE